MQADTIDHEFAAVLTGDLRNSRKLGSGRLAATMRHIVDAARDIGRDCKTSVHFDRHRGDGWQIVLPRAETALRAALRITAALAAQDGPATRIAIGIGAVHLPGSGDLGAADGPAFVASGDLLDSMERQRNIVIDARTGPCIPAMIGLLDWQSRHWSAPQAQALYDALRSSPPTQEEIAQEFGVSRQAIQLRLAGTGLAAIRDAVAVYENDLGVIWQKASA
ncbi:hypothetical protein M8756_00225 [Lutimaribacter sp. EGI FJ00015]|uniref:Uncharacterized protein n=1 Tax=Lutimaribacter degradans TaxID=2945989 RepID=A0ACC5ZTG3_9RHOB|nr:hypothetical protein [Lutimaribacter sp. EGI FJ00013]MCM2561331.1 hypothetical protein [Lutimaribacter sp. EGI FJ00013]MCO0611718.1 hypothetical protein [Lutimaribacter sp. EGI FJ00015]MCO0635160.1 hypothetical protein [Lutimaribacter sp. EGI FJ00014]